MSTAEDGPAPDPATLDAVLTVLARHARDLAPLGAVRLGAGAVSLELGTPAAGSVDTSAVPLPPAPTTPHLAAVPPAPAALPVPDETPAAGGPTVCSTTVGVFYRAAEPGAAPFVAEGDTLAVGQQVGLVEAMKLMIPLEADRAGRIEEFLVADGEFVEHGQAVLRLAAS